MITKEYNHAHNWIRLQRGIPTHCEKCKVAPPDINQRLLHWSNISDMYLYDVTDWQMLCWKCHAKFDQDRSEAKTRKMLLERYGTSDWYEMLQIPPAKRAAMKQTWMDRQRQSASHPLNWGDRELSYLVSTGMNMTNLYRAMGYKGRNVTDDFKERVARLRGEQ